MESPQSKIQIHKQGLVDDGVYGYELESEYSWIRFGRDTSNNVFILYMIGTTETQRNKGYAKKLLEVFFQMIKKVNGSICIGAYTGSGQLYVKPAVEEFSKKYGVRIVKCDYL